jgi:hypothetical protein
VQAGITDGLLWRRPYDGSQSPRQLECGFCSVFIVVSLSLSEWSGRLFYCRLILVLIKS